MDYKGKSKVGVLKLTLIVIVLYISLVIIIAAVFFYQYGCKLSHSDISAFIGSYAGGTLGGLGALLAVFLTISHSLKVQAENSREANDRMAEQISTTIEENKKDKAARREEQALVARQNLANDIAELIGKYITHISNYYYAVANDEVLDINVQASRDEVLAKRKEYADVITELKQANSGIMNRPKKEIELDKERIAKEIEAAEKEYERSLNEQKDNSIFGNRLIANEAYFVIRTKLIDVIEAKDMISFLEDFHRDVTIPDGFDNEWIYDHVDTLMTKFGEFREAFV